MLRISGLAVAALIAAATPECAAQSIHEQQNGTRIEGSFQLGSVVVPLPPGEWVLTGRGIITANSSGGPLKVAEVYLTEAKDGKVARGIYARANLKGQTTGYGWSRDRNVCDRNNVIHSAFDRNFNAKETKCWMVTHFLDGTPNNPPDAYKEFYTILMERKWDLPKLRVSAVYYLTDSQNYTYVHYAFNPEIAGVSLGSVERWDSSDWNAMRIGLFPDRVQFAGKVRAFGEAMLPFVEQGLNGRLKVGEFVPVKFEGWTLAQQ